MNIEKLLFYFIKLCKCTHKQNKNVRGDAPHSARPKIWYALAEDVPFSI